MSQFQPPLKHPSRPTQPVRGASDRNRREMRPTSPVRSAAAAAAEPVSWNDPSQRTPLLMLGGLVLLLVIAYCDMFALTSAAWSDGLYSHGWIVPLFALGLLWLRWEPFRPGAGPRTLDRIRASGIWPCCPPDSPPNTRSIPSIACRLCRRFSASSCSLAECTSSAGPGRRSRFLIFMFPLPTRARSQRAESVAAAGQHLQHVRVANARRGRVPDGQPDQHSRHGSAPEHCRSLQRFADGHDLCRAGRRHGLPRRAALVGQVRHPAERHSDRTDGQYHPYYRHGPPVHGASGRTTNSSRSLRTTGPACS